MTLITVACGESLTAERNRRILQNIPKDCIWYIPKKTLEYLAIDSPTCNSTSNIIFAKSFVFPMLSYKGCIKGR